MSEFDAYVPDLIYVSNKRVSILSKRGVEGVPDFVVEILSPSTARFDKGIKRSIYSRAGVIEYWLIDPALRQISVYYLREDPENPAAVYSANDQFESPVFSGLIFKGAEIFAD
jgi:Uma2 family endonuclease